MVFFSLSPAAGVSSTLAVGRDSLGGPSDARAPGSRGGDVHGDLRALGAISPRGRASSTRPATGKEERRILVFLGDLVGGHRHSRLLLSFVLRLEEEARANGGAVHALLGNHDLLPAQGNLSKMARAEKKLLSQVSGGGRVASSAA